jgi:hypothetical protein
MSSFPFVNLTQSVQVFCFLDLEHPAVAWAVMRGMMVSADYAGTPLSPGFISFMQAGMIEALNNRRIFNEFLIERVRETLFPHQISRMRGMYFFKSQEEAEQRIGDPNWPPYFLKSNLLELQLRYENTFTDVDSNWITFAPLSEDGRLNLNDLSWISRYWRGEPHDAHKPAWERLARGVALVLDEKTRRASYDYMREIFPRSHVPIAMARLASEAGTRGGLTTPFLRQDQEGRMKLEYLWSDAEFHDPEVIEAIAKHQDSPALGRMMAESETWQVPDFRPWGRIFEIRQQAIEGLPILAFPKVHQS